MKHRIVLTGATGFLGQHLLPALCANHQVLSIGRTRATSDLSESVLISSIDAKTDWKEMLTGIDIVVHVAARAHIMREDALDHLAEYRRVNVGGTLNLAKQAAAAGVKRFVFISTIKVNGETTAENKPFTEHDTPAPQDSYGVSKMEAEEGLRCIANDTGIEVVILRPSLIYGPGVKANFQNLLKLADTRLPLPFNSVKNKRSMLYVGNLVDFIVNRCIDHPSAANQTFLISDEDNISLSSLLKRMRQAMIRPHRLFLTPVFIFRLVGLLTRKSSLVERLVGNLQVDSSKARELLEWKSPYTVDEGLQATVDHYLLDRV